MDVWTDPGAWRLRGFPWQAALRLQPEEPYLDNTLWEYKLARMLRLKTGRGDRILDLEVNPPSAYFDSLALTPWQSAAADRAADALRIGSAQARSSYWEGSVRWKRQPLLGVRARLVESRPGGNWSVQEIALVDRGTDLFPSQKWEVEASLNPWEAPLAFDRNPVSRWQTWRETVPGVSIAVRFPEPLPLDGARLLLFQPHPGTTVILDGLTSDATMWNSLAEVPWRSAPPLNYRRKAMSVVKREGFRFILTRSADEGLAGIGRDLTGNPSDWGVSQVDRVDGVYLLRIE
jgi:hypothetical protein